MKTDYKEGDLLQFNENGDTRLFGLDYTEMVYVEKGTFNIGDNSSGIENEKEATITFDKGFFIGKYPVTQQLYEYIMGINQSKFKGKNIPIESVSWEDICSGDCFLDQLNIKFKKLYPLVKGSFALPSEAQWEYAGRGGKTWNNPKFVYAGSNNIHDVGWVLENTNGQTMPVGLKQPNALGIYDMSGNVYEWCQDLYIDDYKLIPKNGEAFVELGNGRILRGGGCWYPIQYCRVARRNNGSPYFRSGDHGFRLVFLPVLT